MDTSDTITEAAIAWHIGQRTASERDWESFVAWLEASPAHAMAYDRVAAADRLLDAIAPRVLADDPAPVVIEAAARFGRPRSAPMMQRWGWMGGATAIAATALVVLGLPGGARPYQIETRPGETRTIALDGTSIEMNGGSRLTLDHADPRVARLESGQALFHVRHDAAHPFAVTSGEVTITDVGTVFDVARAGGQLTVAVSEGSVKVGQADDLVTAGHSLRVDGPAGEATLSPIAAADVGAWRGGRLSFAGEPLASVVAGLERRYAVSIAVAPGLRDRPFTGSIEMTGSAERDIPHLAALIGAGWQHRGAEWVLAPTSGGASS